MKLSYLVIRNMIVERAVKLREDVGLIIVKQMKHLWKSYEPMKVSQFPLTAKIYLKCDII